MFKLMEQINSALECIDDLEEPVEKQDRRIQALEEVEVLNVAVLVTMGTFFCSI